MAWRLGADTVRPLVRAWRTAVGVAILAAAGPAAWGADPKGAEIRVATFLAEESAEQAYFAASIHPGADESLVDAASGSDADVAIVVDTSASQSGGFRDDAMRALRGVLAQVRSGDRVRVYAGDVRAADLSGAFHPQDATATSAAVSKLKQRLPLGNTNLVAVLDTVRAGLVGEAPRRTRSIVYIGDGASIDAANDEGRFQRLIDSLRADRISVHGIAVGPTTNVELMGVFANQTGGTVGLVGGGESAEGVAREIAKAATLSPIWVRGVDLPSGAKLVHGDRLPPLRLDRDSIYLGAMPAGMKTVEFGFRGETAGSRVTLSASGGIEASHPDFAFLPGLVNAAAGNEGLLLPSAGSALFRETARMMAMRAEELVRAGRLALSQGNHRGAKAIAELAIESDPYNEEAVAIRDAASGDRLVVQNPGESLDDVFGNGNEGDTEGGQEEDGVAADGAGDDPFGDGAGDDPFGGDAAAGNAGGSGGGGSAEAAPRRSVPAPPRPGPAPAGDDELLESGGELLDRVRSLRSAKEGRLRAEVRAQLNEASRQMRVDPTGVAGQLKSLLARVETAADVDPQLRQELLSQIRSAIQIASRREAEYSEAQATLQERATGAAAARRMLDDTFRRESQLDALSQQLNSLIREGRYEEADGEVSLAFAEIAGDTITDDSVAGRHFTDMPLSLQVYARDRRLREMRQRNFVDVFSEILKANIPFVGDPPIIYPDSDEWQRLSRRRIERYGASTELVGDSPNVRRIESALGEEVSFNFPDVALEDAIRQIAEETEIPIRIDGRAIEELGLTTDMPVNITLENITLRSFLRLMLRDLDLTYMIKDEVLQVTTTDASEGNLVNKVYPVGDLVVPIIQLGGMGGGMMGGGMGGGMMGGMGGGMGGMGGGMMGGMGGGMGGMGGGMMGGGMGGMGGGMFVVPDDVKLSAKGRSSTSRGTQVSFPVSDRGEEAGSGQGDSNRAEGGERSGQGEKSGRDDASGRGDGEMKVVTGTPAIRLSVSGEESLDDAWDGYFASREVKSESELRDLDAEIRSTVREWNVRAVAARKAGDDAKAIAAFDSIRAVISGAMRAGHVQPWMYQAYAISLQATGAESDQVERALLSAVDFADTPEDVLHIAARLEEVGLDGAALRLCRDVSSMDPYRREPYVMGLRIAKRTENSDAIAWACRGVLSQAWPKSFASVVEEARLVARATYNGLLEEGRVEDAAAFGASLEDAASHDALVRVTWTGEADIDLSVEEPSGTVCSHETPTTAGGGSLLADAFPGSGEDETGAISEVYLCPQGFSGQYRILLRRVWGNVATGKATIEVLTDVGRPTQRYIREQIPLTEKDALVVFEVKEGRRQQEVAEAQLAHLRDVQRDVQHNVLAQFAGGEEQDEVMSDFLQDMYVLSRAGRRGGGALNNNPFFRRGAVGFRPELTVLPTGASLMGLAVVSADRRYVRISPAPNFSQVGDVSTFNFVTGDEGGDGGGGAGGGLGGGGLGGGLGGGFGGGGGGLGGGGGFGGGGAF